MCKKSGPVYSRAEREVNEEIHRAIPEEGMVEVYLKKYQVIPIRINKTQMNLVTFPGSRVYPMYILR